MFTYGKMNFVFLSLIIPEIVTLDCPLETEKNRNWKSSILENLYRIYKYNYKYSLLKMTGLINYKPYQVPGELTLPETLIIRMYQDHSIVAHSQKAALWELEQMEQLSNIYRVSLQNHL
jgi:hypothetical protein